MKAVRYIGKETVKIEEINIPNINESQALIKVAYSGICGSDMFIYSGTHPRARAPLVLGHEIVGEIAELPPSYRGEYKVGDRIVVNPLLFCEQCRPCQSGNIQVCKKLGFTGIDEDGGFAEYVKVNITQLVKIPEGVTYELAAVIEPLAVAIHAVRSSSLRLGDTVMVLGGGPIGFLTAFAAKTSGAARVIVVEPNIYRRNLSESMGFEVLENSKDEKKIKEMIGEDGADIVFDAAGVPDTIDAAVKYCRILGQIVVVSVFKKPAMVELLKFSFAELNMFGVRAYTRQDFKLAIEMVSKYPQVETVISHKLPLEKAQEGIELIKQGLENMKILLYP